MQNRYTHITVQSIPVKMSFDGYLWLSNQKKPEILRNEKVDITLFQHLPFVIEGNLWSEEQQLSIQIRNVDGEYQIASFDLSNSNADHLLNEKTYIAHDLEGIGKYRVVEAWAWEEKEYQWLEGMKTLVPAWTAFRGFVDAKNLKK